MSVTANAPDTVAAGKIVRLSGVSKSYSEDGVEVHALRGIDLEVDAGSFVVVLGPSGSGKTTLLNLVGGLDEPSEGTVEVGGERIETLHEPELTRFRQRSVGFIFQFFNLIPTLTARENIELVGDIQRRAVEDEAQTLLAAVDLGNKADRFPAELSGGEQQRVAVARALLKGANVTLCDEPTGNLDAETGTAVLALLRELNRKRGATFVVVTHNAAIGEVADRVLRLRSGQIVSDERNPTPKEPSEIDW